MKLQHNSLSILIAASALVAGSAMAQTAGTSSSATPCPPGTTAAGSTTGNGTLSGTTGSMGSSGTSGMTGGSPPRHSGQRIDYGEFRYGWQWNVEQRPGSTTPGSSGGASGSNSTIVGSAGTTSGSAALDGRLWYIRHGFPGRPPQRRRARPTLRYRLPIACRSVIVIAKSGQMYRQFRQPTHCSARAATAAGNRWR